MQLLGEQFSQLLLGQIPVHLPVRGKGNLSSLFGNDNRHTVGNLAYSDRSSVPGSQLFEIELFSERGK